MNALSPIAPIRVGNCARLFTEERDALLRARYPNEGSSPELFAALNAMAGDIIPTRQKVADRAKVLKLRVFDISEVIRAGHARSKESGVVRPPRFPGNDPNGPWTDAKIAQLREMWLSNTVSTAEIGRRLGVSKNAAVGKAGRLGLPSKPSPILPASVESSRRTRIAKARKLARGITLPPVASVAAAPVAPAPPVARPVIIAAPVCEPEPDIITASRIPARNECNWPFEKVTPIAWRFCCAPRSGDRVYCTEHRLTSSFGSDRAKVIMGLLRAEAA